MQNNQCLLENPMRITTGQLEKQAQRNTSIRSIELLIYKVQHWELKLELHHHTKPNPDKEDKRCHKIITD